MRTRDVALLSTLLAASAAALNAQNPAAMHCGGNMAMMQGSRPQKAPMPNMPMHNMQDMPMMSGPPMPAMLLQHKKDLSLTAAQVEKLNKLQNDAQPQCGKFMDEAMAAHRDANKLLDAAQPDYAAYTAKMKRMSDEMLQSHLLMAKAGVAARGVLTAEQQERWKKLRPAKHK